MIEESFNEVHQQDWLSTPIRDWDHELTIFRQVMPWQKIINQLRGYDDDKAGRLGKNLRLVVAVVILGKLRRIGDQAVIDLV